jgi:hypothetical protein
MKRFPLLKALAFAAILTHSFTAFSQIEFKLHWMEAQEQWGVFARLEEGVDLSQYTIIGSGQVTLLAPVGTSFTAFNNVSGEWLQNAYISGPEENPEVDYISFGLISNDPEIILLKDEETLLFTFKKRQEECPAFLSLINNDDPLAIYPNSAHANAGNDLSVMDPVSNTVYNFTKNYMPEAWNCNPGEAIAVGHYRVGKERYKSKVAKP